MFVSRASEITRKLASTCTYTPRWRADASLQRRNGKRSAALVRWSTERNNIERKAKAKAKKKKEEKEKKEEKKEKKKTG